MTACDTCRVPGFCCTNIRLFTPSGEFTIWDTDEPGQALRERQPEPLPFLPLAKLRTFKAPEGAYSTWGWTCTRLTAEGRCGDYENRPALCRSFVPIEDLRCLMRYGEDGFVNA
jgi:Fe-S-cluster containining protein